MNRRTLFRVIPNDELEMIRNDETEILQLLQPRDILMIDEEGGYGDLLLDENNDPIIDVVATAAVVPKELVVTENNQFAGVLNGKGISDVVPVEVINGYEDVFGIDLSLSRIGATKVGDYYHGYHASFIGYFIDDVYQGGVWTFTSDDWPGYLGLYGIRSSIMNTLLGVRGIARNILTAIIDNYTMNAKASWIVVPWPLNPMPGLLARMGFLRYDDPTDEASPARLFIEPIAGTYYYYLYRIPDHQE